VNDGELRELSDLNLAETYREWTRQQRGGAIVEEDGLLFYLSESPFPGLVNGVIRLRPTLGPERFLERVRSFFRQRGRGYTLHVRAHADAELEDAVRAQKRLTLLDYPAMVLEQRPPPGTPPGVELRQVVDEVGVRDFVEVTSEAFATMTAEVIALLFGRASSLAGRNRAACVAYVQGRPLSAAMVEVSHGVAGVYFAGTRASARRRGLADACVRFVINAGFELGARVASLQATAAGEAIYRRMGFREISRYRGYVLPMADHDGG
jgi:ribosomal protein S18 acetylase RimI-like enzyme